MSAVRHRARAVQQNQAFSRAVITGRASAGQQTAIEWQTNKSLLIKHASETVAQFSQSLASARHPRLKPAKRAQTPVLELAEPALYRQSNELHRVLAKTVVVAQNDKQAYRYRQTICERKRPCQTRVAARLIKLNCGLLWGPRHARVTAGNAGPAVIVRQSSSTASGCKPRIKAE